MNIQSGETILNGKYRILRLIGEGSFARVWLAEEAEFGGRLVALKELRRDVLTAAEIEDQERRFRQEVELAAMLERSGVPNVIRALTVERLEDGTRLLVMEYADGGSLADLIAGHPDGLPVEQAVGITIQVCRALEGFHKLSVGPIHRDVKPSNILLTKDGRAMLSDFGLAQLPGASGRSRGTAAGHPGTDLYMAPEQLRSPEPLTPAADLYALGCVLFEMLTGKVYRRQRPGTKLSGLRSEVPAWLDRIASKALDEDRWARYADAREMATALQAGLAELERTIVEARERAELERQRQESVERARREAEARRAAVEQVEHLAQLFDDGLAAYQRREWAQAVDALRPLVQQQLQGYVRQGRNAQDLLVEAERRLATPPARQRWVRILVLLLCLVVGGQIAWMLLKDLHVWPPFSSPTPVTVIVVPTPVPTRTSKPAFTLTPTVTRSPTVNTSFTPSVTPSPPVAKPSFTVGEAAINVRAGPGTNYPVIGALNPGESRQITGRNQAGDWWQFDYGGRPGWVSNLIVRTQGAADTVAVAEAPPLPATAPPALTSVQTKPIWVGETAGYQRAVREQLKMKGSCSGCASFSPDGSEIALAAGDGLYILKTDGSQVARLLANQTDLVVGQGIVWSPNGKYIAFYLYDTSRGADYLYRVAIVQRSTGTLRIVLDDVPDRTTDFPAWTADGRLVFLAGVARGAEAHDYVIDADGGTWELISGWLDMAPAEEQQNHYPWGPGARCKPNEPFWRHCLTESR
jgi:serine/threonine-protein kinase